MQDANGCHIRGTCGVYDCTVKTKDWYCEKHEPEMRDLRALYDAEKVLAKCPHCKRRPRFGWALYSPSYPGLGCINDNCKVRPRVRPMPWREAVGEWAKLIADTKAEWKAVSLGGHERMRGGSGGHNRRWTLPMLREASTLKDAGGTYKSIGEKYGVGAARMRSVLCGFWRWQRANGEIE